MLSPVYHCKEFGDQFAGEDGTERDWRRSIIKAVWCVQYVLINHTCVLIMDIFMMGHIQYFPLS